MSGAAAAEGARWREQWIHEIKFDGYYITQGKAGADTFAVIRDAMK
jgi:non-homologous end joining protein Ku